jgi:chromosome partitioning protein
MRTILVINSKGGCGKTTVTTNLASYFAAAGTKVAITDYDPQGSSLQWLKLRSPHLPSIHGANAMPQKLHGLRSLQTWIPPATEVLLIDSPGGVKGLLLQDIVARADVVIIPVGPSTIDVHATADFLKNLLILGRIRQRNVKVAVVANRVRSSMPVYEPLERFLKSLSLPFLTRISDSDTYIRAAEQGVGVFEMDAQASTAERQEFAPIVTWLNSHSIQAVERVSENVVDLAAVRRLVAV